MDAISLFCGAGGLDYGFQSAGINVIWANDYDPDACATHLKQCNSEVVCGDISEISNSSIPDADIILGGFPCQGFSQGGARRLDDPRNKLYVQYLRIINAKKPKIFFGENVKGLLTIGEGTVYKSIINDFSDCGYRIYSFLVNAKNYGVPQDRERIIIVGVRNDMDGFLIDKPTTQHPSVIKDVIAQGATVNINDVCQDSYSSRYMSRNRKRGWDEASYTIPAMAKQVPLYPGSPDMIKIDRDHWSFGVGYTRRLSWRECAAIQTFPQSQEFSGNLTSKYRQIGNAVPCKLAEAFAKQIII